MGKQFTSTMRAVSVLFLVIELSCSEDDHKLLTQFTLRIDTVSSQVATIGWDTPAGAKNPVSYYVYLNDILVYGEYQQNEYSFTELNWAESYNVTVFAEDAAGRTIEAEIEFQTLSNFPPSGLAIGEIQHHATHSTFIFTRATDPENESITYEIYVNGERQSRSENILHTYNNDYFYLYDLYHSTEYALKFVAKDQSGNETFIETSFQTPVPGPVYTKDLVLETQYEVDIFPYTDIKGSLKVIGTDITDISPLSKLVNVNKAIIIEGTSVTSLEAFQNIHLIPVKTATEFIAKLIIVDNPKLESLGSFNNITSLGFLQIVNNDRLRDLGSFNGLTEFTGEFLLWKSTILEIVGNELLENIDGLATITTLRNTSILIEDNASLMNLDGLANCSLEDEYDSYYICNCTRACRISRNAKLANFCGLTQIVATAGHYIFVVENNGVVMSEEDIASGSCAK